MRSVRACLVACLAKRADENTAVDVKETARIVRGISVTATVVGIMGMGTIMVAFSAEIKAAADRINYASQIFLHIKFTEISTVLLDITNDEIDITAGGTDSSAATDAYTITLKERNDNKKTYTLCDNMLIDCEKGIQYSLTKKQLEELKNALGI